MNLANIAPGAIEAEDDILDEVGVSGDALGDVGEEAPKVANLESAVVGHESEESVNSYAVAEGEVQNTQMHLADADAMMLLSRVTYSHPHQA